MLKIIIGKLERKITWTPMQVNWSVVTMNVTLQLFDIYRCGLIGVQQQ